MHDSNDIEPARKDAALLLEDFLSGGSREAAFGALVQSYGGLVYSSALRRTNDPQLAEEVAQNVFAIIARKAASLQKHPALMAWIFKTTRFESSKAMRAERRRQQKHDALAREPADEMNITPDDDAAWRAAVPLLDESLDDLSEKDRQIVLQRFFEERKFKEIAQDSGRSEAACKMQLKRALGKLSKLLTKRGVALSATAIAAGLTSELTHAAPAKALASIAPKALAAASGQVATASTITTTSVQIMSTIKTASITGAAVIAVASAPFFWQQSNAKTLKADLAGLETERLALSEKAERLRSGQSEGAAYRARMASALEPRTVQDLLKATDEPIDVDSLLRSMMDVMMTQDIVGMIRVLLPISNLAPDEYDELIGAIEGHKGYGQMKEMALQMLGSFAPSDDPQKSIERIMALGVEPRSYSDLLSNWGSQDPEAALAWYQEQEAAGTFVSKGVYDHYEGYLLAELVGGIGKKDPQQALELFEQHRDADKRNRMSTSLASSFGRLIRKGGDDAPLRELLAAVVGEEGDNASGRANIVESAARTAVRSGDLDAKMAFANAYLSEARERLQFAVNLSSHARLQPVAERADWLIENTPAELQAEAVGDMIRNAVSEDSEAASEWVGQQTGSVRDSGLSSISDAHTMRGHHQLALEHANRIEDETIKTKALDRLASRWVLRNIVEAREALPEELVDKYRPAPTQPVPTEAALRD